MTNTYLTLVILAVMVAAPGAIAASLAPKVEVEDNVYTYAPANNGAGPMWCYGSTCITRVGDEVFASGIDTDPALKPLNNVRWALYRRTDRGWEAVRRDREGRTREPSPISSFPDGRVLLSVNPTLSPISTPANTYACPARPAVLQFAALDPVAPPAELLPVWDRNPPFVEHSYRGMCADGPHRELLVFNVDNHNGYYWSFLDRKGKWSAHGFLPFPMGVDYPKPEPIRFCYPVLALRNRAAHVLAISDIVEPIEEWRAFKLKLNDGRPWDYDFRRLFYAWTPDIAKQPFGTPVEIASREKTCGHITNLDLWIDARGRAHALWLERAVWYPQMRDVFFPGTPLTTSLEYCIIDQGKVVQRTTIAKGGEGASPEIPAYARFHCAPGGRLYVFASFTGPLENRLIEMNPDGSVGSSAKVPLKHPFSSFMTATERGGSAPSAKLDILGEAPGVPGISYARVRVR